MSATREIHWDGRALSLDPAMGGRALAIDSRCLDGEPIPGCYAHVCALADDAARVPFDQPEVQGARRDALGWWIPLLGDALVCLSTLSLDDVHYAGAITVTDDPGFFAADPFARLFPGTVVRSDLFSPVPAPPGPLLERIGGAPWPGGNF